MLSYKDCEELLLTPPSSRKYDNEAERRFFTTIDNPPKPTPYLEKVYRDYGNLLTLPLKI